MSIFDFTISRLRRKRNSQPHLLAPGLYHFQRQSEEEKTRTHLRLENDGSGLLLVNASRAYHLNPTAAHMAYLALMNTPVKMAEKEIKRVFHISLAQASADYAQFSSDLNELLRPDGACPVCELALDILPPFSTRPSAPYRMDLALTYRCNNACAHCYNARPRSFPELTTSQWFNILDQLWEIGIPHIVFTGGEPTLRDDLPLLVAHAEKNGQITGINTNGRRLQDAAFLQSLVDAGLDHVQITIESHLPEVHNALTGSLDGWNQTVAGIKNALTTSLYVMTNSTLLQQNSPHLSGLLEFLADLGVPTIGLNALIYSGRGATVGSGLPEDELPSLLNLSRAFTEKSGQRLIWYTPTQYCHFDPVLLDLGVKGCTAARYNMCIEPDGSVIPCQSYYQSLGNITIQPWKSIWEHPLAISLRERQNSSPECQFCSFLSECGGGCPLAPFKPREIQPILPAPN
jgi:radical SAM protein with 4Fe4S-binding SPASM domain